MLTNPIFDKAHFFLTCSILAGFHVLHSEGIGAVELQAHGCNTLNAGRPVPFYVWLSDGTVAVKLQARGCNTFSARRSRDLPEAAVEGQQGQGGEDWNVCLTYTPSHFVSYWNSRSYHNLARPAAQFISKDIQKLSMNIYKVIINKQF